VTGTTGPARATQATRWRIGIDVGGTKIAAGLVDAYGRTRDAFAVPTPATEGAEAVLSAIAGAAHRLRAGLGSGEYESGDSGSEAAGGGTVVGVGIGTGGVVDHRRGTVVSATGLLHGWAGTPVADALSARLGLPVGVDNDGNALALGEHRFGAGRGHEDVLYLTLGTGIGGALVLGGRLRRGAHHGAGELGHLPVDDPGPRPCSCGAYGHLEALASGPALTSLYREASGDEEVADLRVVAERAAGGDAVARAALARGAAGLGRTLAGLAATLDPEAVVVGGGAAQAGPALWEPLTAAFRDAALPAVRHTPLLPARLGTAAALIGAAQLAPPAPSQKDDR